MYWLSADEIRSTNLDNSAPTVSDWTLESTPEGGVFAYITYRGAQVNNTIMLLITTKTARHSSRSVSDRQT